MAEHILNLNRDDILSALKYGDCKGYVLFPEIREQRNVHRIKEHALAGRMLEELLQYASDLTCTAIPDLKFKTFFEFAETGNRLNYEKIYFESKRQLHAIVIAELCEESGRFIDAIEERLWKWCDTYSWELPSHVPLTPEAIERSGGIGADESVGLFA